MREYQQNEFSLYLKRNVPVITGRGLAQSRRLSGQFSDEVEVHKYSSVVLIAEHGAVNHKERIKEILETIARFQRNADGGDAIRVYCYTVGVNRPLCGVLSTAKGSAGGMSRPLFDLLEDRLVPGTPTLNNFNQPLDYKSALIAVFSVGRDLVLDQGDFQHLSARCQRYTEQHLLWFILSEGLFFASRPPGLFRASNENTPPADSVEDAQ